MDQFCPQKDYKIQENTSITQSRNATNQFLMISDDKYELAHNMSITDPNRNSHIGQSNMAADIEVEKNQDIKSSIVED